MISSVLLSIHLGFYNNIKIQKCIFLYKHFSYSFHYFLKTKTWKYNSGSTCVHIFSILNILSGYHSGRSCFPPLALPLLCWTPQSHLTTLFCIPLITLEHILNTFWEVCFVNSNFIVFILYFTFFFLLNSSVPQAAINLFL